MAEYLSEFVTNLAMPPAVRPVPHQFAMGDNNAYTFTALLCDARNPDAELMAGTVSGSLLRPDGTTVALGGTKGAAVRRVNLDGGGMCNATPCSVTLPQACFAYPGRVTLVITLVDGTTITQALAVSAVVARTSTDAVVDPGELVPDVAELQAIATELTAAVGGAVRFDEAQTLTDAQKAQARANIGAGEGGGGTVTGAVRYDTAQTLTDAEKTQAQTNIGAAAVSAITSLSADITALENNKAVRYDAQQFLTDTQKAQARTNVGAAGAAETTAAIQAEAAARDQAIADKAVRYDTAQTLTATQQAQARGNIGAAADADYAGAVYPVAAPLLTDAGNAANVIAGGLNTNGSDLSSTARARTQYFSVLPGEKIRFTLNSTEYVIISAYEYTGKTVSSVIRRVDPLYGKNEFTFTATGNFVRVSFAHADTTSTVTEEDRADILAAISIHTDQDALITGDTPSITASSGGRYICNAAAVTELSFTPSASGVCSVRFVSGTTATVLTLPNTVKMPTWWNGCAASTTYEISIADGVYGAVGVWT